MRQDQFWSFGGCPPGGVPLVPVCMPGVISFNGRVGAVTLNQNDILAAGGSTGGLDLDSPAFTGVPTAPTAPPGTDTDQIATTAFVEEAIDEALMNGVAGVVSFNTRTGAVTLTLADITGAGGAPLASPSFTGVPNAPTPAPGTSNTQIATTAFVQAAVTAGTAGVASFNGRTGAVTLTAGDITGAGGALLSSPAFTGVPTAPTAVSTNNSTQVATTAFVQAAIAAAIPALPSTISKVQLTACFQGKPAAGSIVVIPITFSLTIPINMAGSGAVQTTLATASAAFTVYNGLVSAGVVVGTISFSPGGSVAFSGPASALTLAAGSFLTIQAPATQDATLADVGISIAATRN